MHVNELIYHVKVGMILLFDMTYCYYAVAVVVVDYYYYQIAMMTFEKEMTGGAALYIRRLLRLAIRPLHYRSPNYYCHS